jgi:hypothetical protein
MRLDVPNCSGVGSSGGIAPKIEGRLHHMKTLIIIIALQTPNHGQLPESQRELCHDLFGTSKFCFSCFKSPFKHKDFPLCHLLSCNDLKIYIYLILWCQSS